MGDERGYLLITHHSLLPRVYWSLMALGIHFLISSKLALYILVNSSLPTITAGWPASSIFVACSGIFMVFRSASSHLLTIGSGTPLGRAKPRVEEDSISP